MAEIDEKFMKMSRECAREIGNMGVPMKIYSEALYWHSNPEWYYFDEENDKFVLTDKAPQRAIDSFAMWNSNNH